MICARLRRRYVFAIGGCAIAVGASVASCARNGALVSAPLLVADADADPDASAIDGGSNDGASGDGAKDGGTKSEQGKAEADPPEPRPPQWAHAPALICPEDVDSPEHPDFAPPFDACPRTSSGARFSAAATRAERATRPQACCYVIFRPLSARPRRVP